MLDNTSAPVSAHAPFLSNLNVIGNIMLVSDVKKHFLHTQSDEEGIKLLEAIKQRDIAYVHHSKLGSHKRFYAQLVRAVMSECTRIVIDRPYMLVPSQKGVEFIIYACERLGVTLDRILIIDEENNAYKYKEELCSIKKWS